MFKYIITFILIISTLYARQEDLNKVTLQLHWKDQFEFAGYYMAKEKGFYNDAGLDVEFKPFEYGINVVNEIQSGNANYAIGGSDLIIDITNGAKLSMMAAIFQSSPLVLLTTENSGIKSIKDFKNKRVMLTPDTLNSVTYNAMLKKENISFSDMKIVNHSFNINDLINKKVDLFQSYITNEPFSLKQAGIKPIIFDPKDYGFDFYSDILFTSQNEIKNHKQRAIKFKEATLKGWEYAFNHIEESVDVILKKYNSQNHSREALLYEARESKKLAYFNNKPLGDISQNKIERMYDAYNILNLIKTPIDIKEYIFLYENKNTLSLTNEELNFLKEKSTLIISNEPDYPPYDFFENNTPKGYSIDLMKLLVAKLPINIKFETDSWNNLVEKFCDGKIDILHPSDKSKQVLKCAEFTTPIIKDTSQFLLRNDFKKVKTLKDLYGYTIATPIGWQQTQEFKKNYNDKLKVIEVSNTLEAIKKVRAGEADFAFDYGNVLRYLKLKHNFNGLKVEGAYAENSSLDDLYIAVNKKDKILRNIFQKAFDSLSVKEKETLQNKWFGSSNNNSKVILSNQEKEFIKKHPIVKIGYSTLSQPLIIKSKDNSSVKGFAVDLANIIRTKTGLNIEFVEGNWNSIVKIAQDKKIDGLAVTVSKNKNRQKYFNFTSPYITQMPIVFVKKGKASKFKDINSLKNKTMAILEGVEAMEDIANKLGVRKIYYDNIKDVINSVISNETDFSVFFENIFFIANNFGLNYIELAFPLSSPLDGFFSIRKDYPELQSIISKVIESIPVYELVNSKNKWFNIKDNQPKVLLNPKEQEYLQNNEIKMCIDPDWEPYEKIDENGNHIGVAADLLKLIEKRINTKFKLIKTKSWDESLEYKKSGKCDILSFLNKTPKRSEFLNFTEVLYNEPEILVAKSDITYINGFEDLEGKTIGIVKGYQLEEYLSKNYPNIKRVYVKNKEDGLKKVSNEEIYASAHALLGGAYLIRKYNLLDVKIAGETKRTNQYRIGVDKNNPLLLGILDKAVQSISKKEKDKIVSQWISVKIEQQIDYDMIWKIVISFIIIALLLLYRVKILRDYKIQLEKKAEQDLEELRKKDNLLFQQHKMASLGNMIATIAHQWRQPLAQLTMSQNMILRQIETDTLDKEFLESMIKDDQNTIQFMSHTIHTFQNFYKEESKEEEFFLKNAYEDVKYILLENIKLSQIELIENIDPNIKINGCKNFISQVFLSILQNSVHFLKERKIEKPKIFISILRQDNTIEIIVENNDHGIDENIIDQIFDYSFSRRDKGGNSTGLGLYIVKLIIEEKLQGDIEAINTHQGIKFVITFAI